MNYSQVIVPNHTRSPKKSSWFGLVAMLVVYSLTTQAQPDLIRESTYYFKVTNNQLVGSGADTLKAELAKAQFFLLGEEHDMVELQRLTAALFPLLKQHGYQHFAVEIGPVSARKLSSFYHHNESLKKFNTKYYKYVGGGPFGFFDGVDEETLLHAALDNGFKLWGIDFENHNAALFIYDELLTHSTKSDALIQAHQRAYQYTINQYKNYTINKKYPIYTHLLGADSVRSFLQLLPADTSTRELMAQLRSSWRIYAAQQLNNWYPRVENMKTTFLQYYKQALASPSLPKVFVKLGAVHTARGTSTSGFQEVGNTISELATYNQQKSFSVISFARYRLDQQGEVSDELEEEDRVLLQYTVPDKWTLIDLKKLATYGWQRRLTLSQPMKDYISRYDMMLIPPSTRRMAPNYTP